MRLVKFNLENRIKAIELAQSGLNFQEIADTLGVVINTLSSWRKKDKKFNETLLKARKDAMSGIVEKNIFKLANGVETEEVTDNFEYEREDGTKVKRSIKRVKHKPDLKANQALSNKFDLGYSDTEREADDSKGTLNINFSGLSYREVQAELANSPIEAVELESSDYEDLEES